MSTSFMGGDSDVYTQSLCNLSVVLCVSLMATWESSLPGTPSRHVQSTLRFQDKVPCKAAGQASISMSVT